MTKHQQDTGAQAAMRRRIIDRCEQLGLSREDLAARAGMAPHYLSYLTQAAADFDRAGLLRVAAALGLGYQELTEGRTDATPGQQGQVARPALVQLSEAECWEHLGSHGLGRIALPDPDGPTVVPVNYLVDGRTVVYRTEPGSLGACPSGAPLSFEADRVDERLSKGWSVLLVGTAEHPGPAETAPLDRRAAQGHPVPAGAGQLWIRVRPHRVAGRRIGTVDQDGHLV
ncbi:helix-turn-helix domain-containing protein [Streptomyces tateyamensis]|uniref:helix-turn-helix domain-containing protein n=1 Tax=Streptomyces tateyamensis TaxID=565073 RepID=UPI0015E8DD74|nr:pyridoxamine 5'-phosphate oxidase family protein [Streptomyces tateyamensis]